MGDFQTATELMSADVLSVQGQLSLLSVELEKTMEMLKNNASDAWQYHGAIERIFHHGMDSGDFSAAQNEALAMLGQYLSKAEMAIRLSLNAVTEAQLATGVAIEYTGDFLNEL